VAGYKPNEAKIIAASCEFVNHCTPSDCPEFRLGKQQKIPTYTQDRYNNNCTTSKIEVQLPFHYVPGLENSTKLNVVKNGLIVKTLLRQVLAMPFNPYLIGIAFHAFQDSFTHKGYSAYVSGHYPKERDNDLLIFSECSEKALINLGFVNLELRQKIKEVQDNGFFDSNDSECRIDAINRRWAIKDKGIYPPQSKWYSNARKKKSLKKYIHSDFAKFQNAAREYKSMVWEMLISHNVVRA